MDLSDRSERRPNNRSVSALRDLSLLISRLEYGNRTNRDAINLVPSENRLSPLAQQALSTDFYNRYFFNDKMLPDFWEFRGGQLIGEVERNLTIPTLQRLAGAQYVNIRPISGLNTTLLVISAYAAPRGSTVVSIAQRYGGHFAMPGIIGRLGYQSEVISIDRGKANASELRSVLAENTVGLVYVDLQNSLHHLDVESFSSVIRKYSPSTVLHVDGSHVLGLILGGAYQNPLHLGADSFGGSTHKSFPGPHKGVVFSNRLDLAQALESAQFDLVSSHHFAETIALGIAAMEFEYFGKAYAQAVIRNAQALAHELQACGFNIYGDQPDFTCTHQVWFNVGDLCETGLMSQRLFEAGINANVQQYVPGLPEHSFRLGTNEVTFEGATPESMALIAKAFADARDTKGSLIKHNALLIRESFGKPFFFSSLEDLHQEIDRLWRPPFDV